MDQAIFIEENKQYKIDFTQALWATDQLHECYGEIGNFLSDVDFIAETNEHILLIEYKNANIKDAVSPDSFKPDSDEMIHKIARKFYDSLVYVNSLKKDKPINYYYILEYPKGDSVTRKLIRNRISDKLFFSINNVKLITDFNVMSINEWNTGIYSMFPITHNDQTK